MGKFCPECGSARAIRGEELRSQIELERIQKEKQLETVTN